MRRALVIGLSGETLTPDERRYLAAQRPAGIILFARNCNTPDQIRVLVSDALAAIDDADTLILIDQEGGRVQRLRPPHWRKLPPAGAFAECFGRDRESALRAAGDVARLTANDLRQVGINCNCAPVLDLRIPGAHDIIGDRSYGGQVGDVAALGAAVADGLMSGGVVPVIKHIPGHGRALADSHFELPRVDAAAADLDSSDFAPFRALRHLPAAMTAHVVYSAIDAEAPASISPIVTRKVIRGSIGFDGLLMSDDLGMQALTGSFRERAEAVIAAGSDLVLHCSGNLDEARDAAAGTPFLADAAHARFERACAVTRSQSTFDVRAAEATLARVLDGALLA